MGEPGAGKTTLLLELTRDLLDRAVQDESHLIPVIFHLSSWAKQRLALADWLIDELNKRYDVPHKQAQTWVDAGLILPLLDGLDEVAADHRAACVETINAFRSNHHGLLPMVVCSRAADYEALTVRLRLTSAVIIQALSRQQVQHYIKHAGASLAGVGTVLRDDESLWELLSTPLMLSIAALAYKGYTVDEIQAVGTVEAHDYSRAIAGYFLTFDAPSALNTSLALRQAIWRKDDPRWHVCGVPLVFYTDSGSDFISNHLKQVAADLKMLLTNSIPGQPRGRGRIERFFLTVQQMLLCALPGYALPKQGVRGEPRLTLDDFEPRLRDFIFDVYHVQPHSETHVPPQQRWAAGGFLPQMPASLEQLDLLLLTVAQPRKVRRDGIWFLGRRYLDTTLAAYIGEAVIIRYDPRDVAEIRVFYQDRFLCRYCSAWGSSMSREECGHKR